MAFDYLQIIGEYFPDSQAYTMGDPTVYTDIVWVTPQISQQDLDATYLIEYKTKKIFEFSEIARDEIVGGFSSNALGFPNWYDSEPEDQLNMVGSVAMNTTVPYACRAFTQGYQRVNVGGNKTEASNTGYANNTTMYSLEVKFEGISTYLSVQGSLNQTYSSLLSTINADADFSARGLASIEGGNLVFTSKTYGANSSVAVVSGTLLTALTDYVGLETAVGGIDGINGTKTYPYHTSAQMQQVLSDAAVIKLSILQKFNTKKEQIIHATNMAAVDAITWN